MRVALIEPPVPRGSLTNRDLMGGMGIDSRLGVSLRARFIAVLKNEGTRMPVLSLAYAAALLREHAEVRVFELVRGDVADPALADRVAEFEPDWLVGASSFAWLGAELGFFEQVRARCGARRLLIGQSATEFADEILQRGLAEAVCVGDPEVAVRALAEGRLTPGTPGVTMAVDGRTHEGEVGYAEVESLPFPDWSGFARDSYRYFPLLKRRPFLTLLSSRGCPYRCRFCPYPVAQGAAFRGRSAGSVVDEMEQLSRVWGTRSVLFRDPMFSFDVPRAKAICRELIARGLDIEWGVETRLDRMDEELVDLLAESGCRSVEFGGDPLDPEVLRASKRKPIGPERAAALIERMERQGVRGAGLYVVGLPEQDVADVERTLSWLATTQLSYINVEVATPFPGTPLYAQAVERGWAPPITLDDLLAGDPKLAFNGVVGRERMRELQDQALRRFYLSPRRVLREIRSGNAAANLGFMASCAVRLARYEFAP